MCANFMTAKLDPMKLLPHIAISTPRKVFCIARDGMPSLSAMLCDNHGGTTGF